MLAVMTVNVGYFLSVLAGLFLGELALAVSLATVMATTTKSLPSLHGMALDLGTSARRALSLYGYG